MSDTKPDPRQIAREIRDQLIVELARVDAFIAMAETMTDPEEFEEFERSLTTEIPPSTMLH